jgi:folate-dependent phosphoribosylglycinamide formyltransferase PurN
MRLAIVTNKQLHHKYFASELYEKFDVKLIIHPIGAKKEGFLKSLKTKKIFFYGPFWAFLKLLSLVYNVFSGHSMSRRLKKLEGAFFKEYQKKYNTIPKDKIVEVETVNSEKAINLVKEHNIDIICFLGGDIAKKDFIESAGICSLNYHSGISPFYNGNKTTFHAVKDFRPNFAGGTLMYITERIDGGGILSHFLPEIKPDDNAAILFMKGIIGTVKLYEDFLNYIKDNDLPKGVVQQRSFKYVRNIDWTIVDDIKLKRFEKKGVMRIYKRDENIIRYYNSDHNGLADIYTRSLEQILKKK